MHIHSKKIKKGSMRVEIEELKDPEGDLDLLDVNKCDTSVIKTDDSSNNEDQNVRRSSRVKNRIPINYHDFGIEADTLSESDDFELEFNRSKKRLNKMKKKSSKVSKKKLSPQSYLANVLTWKSEIELPNPNQEIRNELFKIVKTNKVLNYDLSEICTNIQALYINIKWKTEEYSEGTTMEEFSKLNISKKAMKSGIVFLWSEKSLLEKIMKKMEAMGFVYVENFAIVNLDQTKLAEKGFQVSSLEEVNAIQGLHVKELFFHGKNKGNFFCKTKRVLLLFRKFDGKQLELRHQRTADIFFDLNPTSDLQVISPQMSQQIYSMIETLLPKAQMDENNEKSISKGPKMVELFGDSSMPRKFWAKVCQE